jgi:glycosyltransferase involved in cell wall biosynthesis
VALIFSHGNGLRTWFDAGFFSREIDYYRDIAELFGQVIFLTYDKSDPTNLAGVPDFKPIQLVFNDKRVNYRIFGLLAPLLKYGSLKNVDVIKTNQLTGSWTGLILKWVLRKPLLARCGYIWSLNVRRGGAKWPRGWAVKAVERFVLKRSNAIAVPDQFALNYLSKLHGIPEGKFTVLPNFVDTDRFAPGDVSDRISDRFLFVGRLSSEKRPELAVAAAASAPEAQLDVVGDGAEVEKVRSLAEHLENVNLLGGLPHVEVSKMMSTALGLVITSRYEGSPKAVIESMSSGLPVIAVKSPGLTEIVQHGVNGLLVDPDAESIAGAMRKLMNDPDLWLRLSENGRRMALETYSKSSVIRKEISLLTRLMNRAQANAKGDS